MRDWECVKAFLLGSPSISDLEITVDRRGTIGDRKPRHISG